MNYSSLIPITGTILNLSRQDDCSSLVLLISSDEGGQVNFIVDNNTVVLGSTRLRVGMRVIAYYDGDLPVPLIYPPRYQAEIVTMLWRNQSVALAYFDENLLAADQSLQLNLDRQVKITTANGQSYSCSPGNAELLVYYTAVTRSIPPMTTPQKIIVLCPE